MLIWIWTSISPSVMTRERLPVIDRVRDCNTHREVRVYIDRAGIASDTIIVEDQRDIAGGCRCLCHDCCSWCAAVWPTGSSASSTCVVASSRALSSGCYYEPVAASLVLIARLARRSPLTSDPRLLGTNVHAGKISCICMRDHPLVS